MPFPQRPVVGTDGIPKGYLLHMARFWQSNFREDTGEGQFVDVSGAECLMKFIDYNMGWYHMDGKIKERLGKLRSLCFSLHVYQMQRRLYFYGSV